MNRSDSVHLSPRGLERRAALLGALQVALRRRIRRRRALRAGGVLAVVAFVALSVFLIRSGATDRPPRLVEPGPIVAPCPPPPPDAAPRVEVAPIELRHARLEVVRNRPDVLERYTVRNRAIPPAVLIGDDELLRGLEEADRPSGLVRVDDRVIVLAHAGGSGS